MSFPGPDPLYRIDSLSRAAHSGAQPGKKGRGGSRRRPRVCVLRTRPCKGALKKALEQGQGAGSHEALGGEVFVRLCSQGSLGTTVGNHLQGKDRDLGESCPVTLGPAGTRPLIREAPTPGLPYQSSSHDP